MLHQTRRYMRVIRILSLFCFYLPLSAQTVSYQLPPMFTPMDGDEIRKYYQDFKINYERTNEVVPAVFHSNSIFFNPVFKSEVALFPELDAFKKPYSPTSTYTYPTAVPVFDSLGVIATVNGINSGNKRDFEYRVIRNRSEVFIPWSTIDHFMPAYWYKTNPDGSEQTEVAYLGTFTAPFGESLTFEARKKKKPEDIYAVSVVWIKRAPVISGTFAANDLNKLLNIVKYQWKHDFFSPDGTYYGDVPLEKADSLLVARREFDPSESSIFFYLQDKIRQKDFVEYNLISGRDSSGWKANTFDTQIIWLKDLKPGHYTLLTRYSLQRQHQAAFPFEVKPAWYQTNRFYLFLGVFSLLLAMATGVYFQQRRKLKKQVLATGQVSAELKAIRSQFNPHFVFNALSSIQSLIGHGDTVGAEKYLNDFSGLMRQSLKESERELVSIAQEADLLDKYLRLEQLRFGFKYNLSFDLDIHTTDIPALLLQPVLENAVKHGVSGRGEEGQVELKFYRTGNDMHVEISDNGRRWDPARKKEGFGLKLTEERIRLLSQVFPGQEISLDHLQDEGFTRFIFTFKNWMA